MKNQTRDLPAYSAVRRPTAPSRAPHPATLYIFIYRLA